MYITKQLFSKLIKRQTSPRWKSWKFPERLKGGMIENWADFWVTIAKDYLEVSKSVITFSKERPLKTCGYITGIGSMWYTFLNNPDEQEFKDSLQRSMNDSAMLSKRTRNPEVDHHFHTVTEAMNLDLLRRTSIGLFSILWIDNYSKDTGIYQAQCSYLKPRFIDFHKRIVDVGFLHRWWNIYYMMEDYDINHQDWSEELDFKYTLGKLVNRFCNIFG